MLQEDEWGPWIEHDGSGCPVVGWFAEWEVHFNCTIGNIIGSEELVTRGSTWALVRGIAGQTLGWDWSNYGKKNPATNCRIGKITRYRVRKPKGMKLLEDLLVNLPVEIKETEDA